MHHALRAFVFVLLACCAFAQAGGKKGEEEKFKDVDPYTKGDPELVRAAGYISLKPFQWSEGIFPQDMVEVLGGIELLWAETAHFKICSSLNTYKSKGDAKENAALEKELEDLALRMPGCKFPKAAKLDPWLRLHLYAMRLEKLHAEFSQRLGFKDSDFHAAGTTDAMGSGPHLGMALKPTVMLMEKSSSLGRFNLHYTKSEESGHHRHRLDGGSMFLGVSAQSLRDMGYPLDAALHCSVAAGVVGNLLDGLRDSYYATPLWFNIGLAHWFSRRIDERFSYYANGTTRYVGDDLHEWQPRVRGLVENKFAYTWNDMLATLDWPQLTPQAHMIVWSRIDWMMQQKVPNLRAFIDPLSVRIVGESKERTAQIKLERASAALSACLGRTVEQCDTEWRAWVLKTYARK